MLGVYTFNEVYLSVVSRVAHGINAGTVKGNRVKRRCLSHSFEGQQA